MKIVWHKQAKDSLGEVARYIKNSFGIKAQKDFVQKVRLDVSTLKHVPYIGAIEPLLTGRDKEYRSIVINSLNKLVYYVSDDTVYIVALWDTRREPRSQAERSHLT